MSAIQGSAYDDCTTMRNFMSWASFYGKAFVNAGWKQANDTGQINWPSTILTISQVAVSGGNAVYTYDATQPFGGAPLAVGMPVAVVGFVTAGNNITALNGIVTALGGSGAASTFTVATTTQVNETHAATGGVPPSVNISQVAVAGGNATYTYNATTPLGGAVFGPVLRVGQAITIIGFATGGNNISNRIITAVGGAGATSTFTMVATTQANETHAAIGALTPNIYLNSAAMPSVVGTYEIYQSTDALSATAPITVRFDYGTPSGAIPKTWFQVGCGGTNGSGTLLSPCTALNSSHATSVAGADGTVLRNNYGSGDAGNCRVLITAGPISAPSLFQFFAVSRSYDQNGNQTNNYVMFWTSSSSVNTQQAIFPSLVGGGVTPPEYSFWIAAVAATTGQTQGFGGIVAVSPAYQVVGGFNNPSPDICIGKTVDFTDGAQVNVSFYNVNHNYIVCNPPKTFTPTLNTAMLMRFE
jgi:hypothetical protein